LGKRNLANRVITKHHDLNAQTNKSTKLFLADVRLPRTNWKAVPQPWVSSR